MPRPYRTWGYPIVPLIFVIGALALTVNTFVQKPVSSSLCILAMLIGLIFYARWRKRAVTEQTR